MTRSFKNLTRELEFYLSFPWRRTRGEEQTVRSQRNNETKEKLLLLFLLHGSNESVEQGLNKKFPG